MATFQQIMAKDQIVGKSFAQQAFESIYVIDAFADEGPLVEEILVDIGYDARVRIDARLPTEKTDKPRSA